MVETYVDKTKLHIFPTTAARCAAEKQVIFREFCIRPIRRKSWWGGDFSSSWGVH